MDLTYIAFKDHISSIKVNSRAFSPEPADPYHDEYGVGTWSASVILKMVPDVTLYVA